MPSFDPNHVAALERSLGADGVVELMRVLARDIDAIMARLRPAVAGGDGADIRELAHALKGATVNMGATSLAAAARALEEGADDARRRISLLAAVEAEAAAACDAANGFRRPGRADATTR